MMAEDEDGLWDFAKRAKHWAQENVRSDESTWHIPYTEKLEGCIDSTLTMAQMYLHTKTDPSPDVVHGYRRSIAIFHELIELTNQGEAAFNRAREDGAFVLAGRG